MKTNKELLIGFFTGIFAVICVYSIGLVTANAWGNQGRFDTKYTFTDAYINEGEWKHVKVKKWYEWDDSDMLQVMDDTGAVYYTHSSNIVLEYQPKK